MSDWNLSVHHTNEFLVQAGGLSCSNLPSVEFARYGYCSSPQGEMHEQLINEIPYTNPNISQKERVQKSALISEVELGVRNKVHLADSCSACHFGPQ